MLTKQGGGTSIKHFVGQAQSGTGKTAAFSLSMLSRSDPAIQEPQALCVIPTRELARQIEDVVKSLAKYTTLQTFLMLKDTNRSLQNNSIFICS